MNQHIRNANCYGNHGEESQGPHVPGVISERLLDVNELGDDGGGGVVVLERAKYAYHQDRQDVRVGQDRSGDRGRQYNRCPAVLSPSNMHFGCI